jgi:hypothetical protein
MRILANSTRLSRCPHATVKLAAQGQLKDAFTEAKTFVTSYELKVATARVHKRFPEVFENPALEKEREDLFEKELK